MTDRILLTNGKVLTCSGDTAERPTKGEVLIEGERIAKISRDRIAVDTASTRVVDVRGATIMPGLGDAHTHISWPLDFVFDHGAVAAAPPAKHALDVAAVAKTYIESGYTMIVGAGATQPQDDLLAKASIDAGALPGPRIVPSGAMIAAPGGLGADGGMMEIAEDAAGMREIVRKQCESGVRALKLFISGDGIVPQYPSNDLYMNDDVLEAAVNEADRHGAYVTVHARGAASVSAAARTGVRIIHHACFIDDDALSALKARGDDVWVCPGIHYLWQMTTGQAAPWGVTSERIDKSGYRTEFTAQVDGIKAMAAAGIKLVSGGDFGHQWTKHGTYAAEMQRYVDQCGLTPIAAIHTGTRNFAGLMGVDVGEVRAGALADLLVIDGDPTADITVLQQGALRRAVIKGGQFAYVNPALYP